MSLKINVLKPIIFILLLVPFLWLVGQWYYLINDMPSDLTANPIEYTNRFLGDWALRYILLTLSITPLAHFTGWRKFILFRRMIGLYAFAYALLHLNSYIVLDHYFNWNDIWQDIVKRNFITIGMIAIVGLLPLALTSTNKMIKKMGSKNWKKLHKLIYPISILAVFHFTMMKRGNQLEPKIYWAILAFLLSFRLYQFIKKKKGRI